MDQEFTNFEIPRQEGVIPVPPSRAEEIKYLDDLEHELRTQSYYNSGYHPDPARRYMIQCDEEKRSYRAQKYRRMLMIGLAYSPVALWLAKIAPAKADSMGVPYRAYPMQHRVRFWGYFAAFEAVFTLGFYYTFCTQDLMEKQRYPLNKIRVKTL